MFLLGGAAAAAAAGAGGDKKKKSENKIKCWYPEISHGGSFYTMDISKCYKSKPFFPLRHCL